MIDAEQRPLSQSDRSRIAQEVSDEILGHGPLEPLLRDATITEIMVNGPDSIFIERDGRIVPTDIRFSNEAHLRRIIDKIVGRDWTADRRVQSVGRCSFARRVAGQRGGGTRGS